MQLGTAACAMGDSPNGRGSPQHTARFPTLCCAQGVSPFEVDEAALAALAPGLVLTQDACASCDADADGVLAALQRAGLLGGGLRAPPCVLTLAPRTLADALETILEVRATTVVQQVLVQRRAACR